MVIWNEYFSPLAPLSEEIVALLLDAGAALEDDQNNRACTPLMTAVNEKVCEDSRLLLERGANPNKFLSKQGSAYSAGWSLLSSAWLNPEMVQGLLEFERTYTVSAQATSAHERIEAAVKLREMTEGK